MSAVDRLINIELFGPGELLGTKIDYSPNDADREWVASQLGDVPRRHTAEQWPPAELEGMNYLIEHAKRYEFNRIPDYFGETVPVESLGRPE